MLTTAADACSRVCLMDMVNGGNAADAGRCLGEACSAWRWEAAPDGAAAEEHLGYCGMIGCVGRTVRKHPRRMIESTVVPG